MATYRVYYAAANESMWSIDTTADDWEEACAQVKALAATVLFSGGDEEARKAVTEFTSGLEFTTTYKGLSYDAATPRALTGPTEPDSADFPQSVLFNGKVVSGQSPQWRKHMNSMERAHAGMDLGVFKGAAYPVYSMDQTDLIYHQDASTLSLSDDDPVTAWAKVTGAELGPESFTGSPVYKSAGLNGQPAVEFDTATYMDLADSTFDFRNGCTLAIVFQTALTDSNLGLLQLATTATNQWFHVTRSGASDQVRVRTKHSATNEDVYASGVMVADTPTILSVRYGPGSYDQIVPAYVYKNGAVENTGSLNVLDSRTYDENRLCSNGDSGSADFNGVVAEFILLGRQMTTDEHTELIDHLKDKYGIS